MTVQVTTVTCLKCGQTIYSRCKHDFARCKCKNVGIDGGFSYTKLSIKDLESYNVGTTTLDLTKQELYQDWKTGTDKYGIIT